MDEKGDIPERDEVMPSVMDGPKATYNLVKERLSVMMRSGFSHDTSPISSVTTRTNVQ